MERCSARNHDVTASIHDGNAVKSLLIGYSRSEFYIANGAYREIVSSRKLATTKNKHLSDSNTNMKVMLTSALGGSGKVNGVRVPSVLIRKNGLLDNLRAIWTENAKVLIICADPNDYKKNDEVCSCLEKSFPLSGLSVSKVDKCDDRNPNAVANLQSVDVLILAGGHVPTQNRFIKQLGLKERLIGYKGIVLAWSAGSINCADPVYAGPEFDGEATDPSYQRWLTGLGLTKINILPHFQKLKDDYLDGMRLIEDITYADSVGHEIIAISDGSYVMIDDEKTTLYGEAYMIKDRQKRQICADGESLVL